MSRRCSRIERHRSRTSGPTTEHRPHLRRSQWSRKRPTWLGCLSSTRRNFRGCSVLGLDAGQKSDRGRLHRRRCPIKRRRPRSIKTCDLSARIIVAVAAGWPRQSEGVRRRVVEEGACALHASEHVVSGDRACDVRTSRFDTGQEANGRRLDGRRCAVQPTASACRERNF